jgi:hypothetical protein
MIHALHGLPHQHEAIKDDDHANG